MRSAQEIAQYQQEIEAFIAEANRSGEIFYDDPEQRNRATLNQAMFALQEEQQLSWQELWQRRIFASVFVSILDKLEKRSHKTREVKETELHARDRQSYRQPHETREDQEKREARERQEAIERRRAAKLMAEAEKNERKEALALAEDIKANPQKYVPSELAADYSVPATVEQMKAMEAPVLKYWCKRHEQAKVAAMQQAALDKAAERALRNLVK
jgi:hypothetical protein